MRPSDKINKMLKELNFPASSRLDQKIALELRNIPQKHPDRDMQIWRMFMNRKMMPVSAVLAIIMITIIYFSFSSGSNVAFAEVLKAIQTTSYRFTLSLSYNNEKPNIMKAMVLEPGIIRYDTEFLPGLGTLSSISNINNGESLLLFHEKKIAQKLDSTMEEGFAGAKGIAAICNNNIRNLWSLKDGSETNLGRKTINGIKAEGFSVKQADQWFDYTINIWADAKTSLPVKVEIEFVSIKDASQKLLWEMSDFELVEEPDRSLFSLEPPAGYTFANQFDIDDMQQNKSESPQAAIIIEAIEDFRSNRKDKAIEALLNIDWTKDIVFSSKEYTFTLTEQQYVGIKFDQQQQVMKKVMDDLSIAKKIAVELTDRAEAAIKSKDYDAAEKALNTSFQFGRKLNRNEDLMLITRLVGIAIERLTSQKMIELYTETNNIPMLEKVRQYLKDAQDKAAEIKAKAKGQ